MKRIIAREGNRVTYEYPSRVTKDAETGMVDAEYNGGTRVVHVVSAEPITPCTTNAEHTQRVAETAARLATMTAEAAAQMRQDEDAVTIARLRRQLAAQERIAAGLAQEVERLQEVDCARPFVVGDLVRGAQRIVGGVVSGPDGCFAVDVDPPMEVTVGEPVAGTSGLTVTVDPEADTQRIPRVKSEPPGPALGED